MKDKEKRGIYDKYGEEGLKQQAGQRGGGGFTDPFDLFNSFGFGGFPGGQRGQRHEGLIPRSSFPSSHSLRMLVSMLHLLVQVLVFHPHRHLTFLLPRLSQSEERVGHPLHVDLEATLEDLYNGRTLTVTQKKQVLCHRCRGTGAENPDEVTKCPVCGGSGVRLITQQLGPGFITQTQTTYGLSLYSTCPSLVLFLFLSIVLLTALLPLRSCDKCGGKGKIVKGTCPVCKGHKVESGEDTITVIVEKGMREGHEIVRRVVGFVLVLLIA